jgi:ABC-type glycerol-3-phosphate transport system permease component
VILAAYFRSIPQEVVDAAMIDGAGRVDVLLRIVVPLARPGIVAVAAVVGLLAWNDFAGAVVLIQRPDLFTVQQALTRFSTFYSTDQGLSFAAMAIVLVPPLVAFVLLRSRLIQGFSLGLRPRG